MIVIFMLVVVTAGDLAGQYQTLRYPTMAACERDRPLIETGMRFNGYRDIVTVCKVSKEKSA